MAITTTSGTISAGQSLSSAIDCTAGVAGNSSGDVYRMVMPPAWDGGNLTFQVSHDNVTWGDLFGPNGNEITVPMVPGATMPLIDLGNWTQSLIWLKVRAGTRAYPWPQSADRVFTLIVDPRP